MKQGKIGMSFRHAPGKFLVIGRFLEKIVSALLPFLTMLVSARFIDLVLNQRMEEAIRDACLLGALILCQRLGGNLDTWMRIHQRKVLFPYLDERMIGKISRIPYGFLENTEIQDALERVSKDPEEVLNGVLESGFSMVCFLISNGCLVVWLITQAPVWISPVIVVLLVGFGFFAVKGGQKQYEAKKEVTLGKRKAAYAEEILGNRDAANERVLFGFGDWVNGIFLKERQTARLRERKARRWWFIGMNMGGFLAIALSILVIFALIFPVVQGNTSVGVFVSLVTSFMAMAQSLTWQLPGMLKEMEQGRQLLGDMKRILELPEYEEKPDSSAALSFESLEFSHVSFHYPNTEAMVLKDMCFRIEKGHHYAFVGRNGCGKSTIVKLILRLYEPDSGEILLNGQKIETFSREQVWKLFGVLVSARFIDLVLNQRMEEAIRDACLLGALILCQRLGGNLDTWMRIHQRKVLFPYLDERMIGKISRIPYGFLENTEIQDALERVSKDPEEVLNGVLESGFSMVCFLISNGCLVVWLITQAPVWISPVIVVLLVGFGFFAVKGGQKQYEAKKEVTLGKRKAAYAEEILGNRDAANERVLFGFGDWVNGIFLKERQTARLRERKARRWWFIGMNMGGFLAIALSILVIFALIFPVVQGNTSVGVFVSLVTSFMAMAQSLTWQLPGMLKEMEQGRQLLGDMKRILELPEYEEKPDSSAALSFESLEFSHVSFHYPNTEAMVLKDMCFRIEKGHHYAFVGRNGCGKSTIVKLILRLYEPDSGEILLNGQKIETFSREQVWKLFGVLFQDYAKYPVSVADNIAPGADAGQRAKIAKAAETSELDNVLEKLPKGMDTVLGKITEDGVDVSGGEWQRIAMARLYYLDAELKILDEPTAAIDPVREQQIYQKFLKLYQDTTTIMITHRLGATSLCDWIIAIEDGKAMEQGSHEDLMAKNGIYCEMYETQRRWYL